MNPSEYARDLGMIVGNLQSLEYLLRGYLYEEDDPAAPSVDPARWYKLEANEILPLNSLTSYESLGQLIDRYNSSVVALDPRLQVGKWVVGLRDALAHGRISGALDGEHLTLLKFAKPQGDQVRVETVVLLTPEWMADQREKLMRELEKVHRAGGWVGSEP